MQRAPHCDMALVHDDDLERILGVGDRTSLENLQPDGDSIMDHLERSMPEIGFMSDTLPSNDQSPRTDTEPMTVAMLSEQLKSLDPPASVPLLSRYPASSAQSRSVSIPRTSSPLPSPDEPLRPKHTSTSPPSGELEVSPVARPSKTFHVHGQSHAHQRLPGLESISPPRQHRPLSMTQPSAPSSSSKSPATTPSVSNSRVIFEKALKAYNKKTKQDLTAHPLAAQLQTCDSPAAILTMLQEQVDQFKQSRSADERLQKWLNPMINVLYAFSQTLGEGVGLAFSPPAEVIFAGAGVLLLVNDLVYLLVKANMTSVAPRRPRKSKQAKTSLSISFSASKISSDDWRFIPRSHRLRRWRT
ncbi:hypothetical protein EDB85DRAFT_414263 [Lactarius pseudohatsudake]|nr:hypothetical protein EDB85DRAFT_414263 [Lactarius pseudohatsudake]